MMNWIEVEPESLLTVDDLRRALKPFNGNAPVRVAIYGGYHLLNTVVSTHDHRAILAPQFYPEDKQEA